MDTHPRSGRAAPALALLLGLTLVGCAGDPIPPGGTPGGPGPGPTELPTTDEVLDVDAAALADLEDHLVRNGAGREGLELEELRILESTATASLGDALPLGLDYYTWADGGDGAWSVLGTTQTHMSHVDVANDLTTIVEEGTYRHDSPDLEIEPEWIPVLQTWQITFVEAAEAALTARPGEVLAVMPADFAGPTVFVAIREEDGAAVRVGVDAVSGQLLNAVEIALPEDDASDTDRPETDQPYADLPTSDDVLDVSSDTLQMIETQIGNLEPADLGLSAADVRMLEQTALSTTGDDLVFALDYHPWQDDRNGGWMLWGRSITEGHMSGTSIATDLTTVLDEEYHLFEDETDQAPVDAITSWELTLSDAVDIALAIRPGEIMMALPPNEPDAVLFVVVREGDGTYVRIAFDGVTGEPLNVVDHDADDADTDDAESDGTDDREQADGDDPRTIA